MSKEFYEKQPAAVEVYPVNTGTDIILRRDIKECTLTNTVTDEEGRASEVETIGFGCEEVQHRYRGTVTAEEVTAKFDYWWSIASGKTEDEAEDDDAESKGLPTLAERVSIMEDAVAALAEVILDAE